MAELIAITDHDDPRIADYLDIRDRDLAGRHGGRFAAEGESVLKVLLSQSRYQIQSVLLAENRVAGLMEWLEPRDIPVYVAPNGVMDQIIGFPIHRGMMAMGLRGALPSAEELLASGPALVVGFCGIANHDNMGGIFRNAAAFGAGAALIDRESCDPLYRKALRVSVGGVLKVPFARVKSAMAMAELLAGAGYRVLTLSPRGAISLSDIRPTGRDAILLGAEGPGLSEAVIAMGESVRIDMAGGFDSLNVATTSGIVLHQLKA